MQRFHQYDRRLGPNKFGALQNTVCMAITADTSLMVTSGDFMSNPDTYHDILGFLGSMGPAQINFVYLKINF